MGLSVQQERIESRIYLIRGCRVMVDRDLARVFGVTTRRLNEQVKRNHRRFPDDFVFRLTMAEAADWMSQNATSNPWAKKGLRKPPRAFTEHGAVMLAAVLNSDIAVTASIRIVRAFNRLRKLARAHKDLAQALGELSRRVAGHDDQFEHVFAALRRLEEPPVTSRRRIGFRPP